MGRVESGVPVAVEQAQLIDPSGFRFDTSIAQATENIGGILTELDKRKKDLQDRISSSNVNAAINNAQLGYQQEIVGKPLDQHAAILRKHVNAAKSISGQQRMTNEARALVNAKLGSWGQSFAEQGELATIVAMNKEAGIRVADDLGNALVNGDQEDILEAEAAYDEHFAANPEEGKQQKEKIEALAVKQMRDNAIQSAQELAARTPNAVITRVEAEQKLRKTKEPSDFPNLNSKDLEAVRDYAETVGIKAKDESTQMANQVITDNYTAIANGAVNINQMVQDISANPNMSAEDKAKAIEKTRTFFTGWHSTEMANRVWPLVDDDTAITQLNTDLTAQSSGTLDINEMNEKINDAANKGLLSRATRDKLRARAAKGGNDAIDKATGQFTKRVSNALIGRLTEREARFRIRETTGDLTPTERRQASSVGFLLQVGREQLNRYNADLDKALREAKGGRESISGVEATAIAASVWETYKTKTDTQRIREFNDFTGSQSPRPEGFPLNIWNTLGNEARAAAVVATEQGLTSQQIQDMVSK
jgi:hypothetical protein